MGKNSFYNDLPDFEVLSKMAKEDPKGLEELRLKVINSIIDSAPEHHQRKLRGLQFKIDMEREKAKNPMAACIKISQMMHESFTQLRDALKDAQENHIKQLRQINIRNKKPFQEVQKVQKAQTAHRIKKSNESKAEPSAKILEFPVTT